MNDVAAHAKRSARKRLMARVLLVALGVVLGLWIALPFGLAWGTLHPKPGHPSFTPAAFGLAFDPVAFRSDDGTLLAGWLIPATDNPPRAVVVMSHGVDGGREGMVPAAAALHRHGYECLMYDSRGRGESGGAGCTLGVRETGDLLAAVRFAKAQPRLAGRPVAVLGLSLGGAVAIMAAARDPSIRAVIAESPFSRLDRAIDNHFRAALGICGPLLAAPTRWVGESMLGVRTTDVAPDREIGRIAPRAVLLIQDADDRIAPPDETRRLFVRAGEPKQLLTIPGAPHVMAIYVAPETYERAVTAFLDAHLATAPETPRRMP